MTEKKNDPVTFSIHERLVLDGPYNADEFLSMALEPDMTIEEDTHYVKVTGALRLTGEFRPAASDEIHPLSINHHKPSHRVKSVFATDVGTYCIEHQFPVDITIPSYRINNMEDLYVTIDSFDYFLESSDEIDLSAEIVLSGLSSTKRETEPIERESIEKDPSLSQVDTGVFFDEQPEYPFITNESNYIGNNDQTEDARESFEELTENEFNDVESDEYVYEFEAIRLPDEHPFMEELEEAETPHIEMKERKDEDYEEYINYDEYEQNDEDEDVAEEPELEQEADVNERPNALYLTKMLSDDTKPFSKLRMYFIQPGDSLSSVAEKYQVAATSLIRMNRLESDQLQPGEILYIPVKS